MPVPAVVVGLARAPALRAEGRRRGRPDPAPDGDPAHPLLGGLALALLLVDQLARANGPRTSSITARPSFAPALSSFFFRFAR
jgi:hypothetical protein